MEAHHAGEQELKWQKCRLRLPELTSIRIPFWIKNSVINDLLYFLFFFDLEKHCSPYLPQRDDTQSNTQQWDGGLWPQLVFFFCGLGGGGTHINVMGPTTRQLAVLITWQFLLCRCGSLVGLENCYQNIRRRFRIPMKNPHCCQIVLMG